jgi:hypothetical protein
VRDTPHVLGLLPPLLLTAYLAPTPTVPPPPGAGAPEQPDTAPPDTAPPDTAPPGDAPTEPDEARTEPGDALTEPTPAVIDAPSDAGEPVATEADAPTKPPADVFTIEAAPACPCDSSDWKCMQDNTAACHYGAEPPEPVPFDGELPPRPHDEAADPPRAKPKGPQRTGFLIGAAIGYLGCRTFYCEDDFKGAFGAEGELGYRWRRVAPVLVVAGGRGRYDVPELEDVRGRLGFIDVGIGALIFPVARTVVDPYFGMTLGIARSRLRLSDTLGLGVSGEDVMTRGAVRFMFGLNFFLAPRVTIGPRFAISVPFAGRWCVEFEPDTFDENRCGKIKELAEEEMIDPADLPRSFAITLNLRLILPTAG